MKDILLEIGTEEIPAGFLVDLLPEFKKKFESLLRDNLVKYKKVELFATPRRIVSIAWGVEELREEKVVKIQGPPEKIAFKDGNPTKAYESFVKKNALSPEDVKKEKTARGIYLYAEKAIGGGEVKEILPELFKDYVFSMHFPKSMRWNESRVAFARPVRWIVALWGKELVHFDFAGVTSGRISQGHRFLGEEFEVKDAKDYLESIRREFVIIDGEERKRIILEELKNLSEEVKGTIPPNEELLNEVVYLVEYPEVLRGNIDKKFLNLPEEVIIISAQHHQKYFTAVDKNGRLLPYSFTVSNMPIDDTSEIIRGNERVLRSRLEDAEFFFREDLKIPLIELLEKLKDVTYQKKLGSIYDKVLRDIEIANYVIDNLGWNDIREKVERTLKLAKCDLLTDMVYEFPELQGVMGKEYAIRQGEDEEIAEGIWEHYLPRFAGDELPLHRTGIVASLSDKIDTVVSGFAAGLKITGAQDPFGLRRAAIGTILILLEKELLLSLSGTIKVAFTSLENQGSRAKNDIQTVEKFFKVRFENILSDRGFRKDLIQAIIDENFDVPYEAFLKIVALSNFIQDRAFIDLSIVFKRVVNILRGQKPVIEKFSEGLLTEDTEKLLYDKFLKFKDEFESLMGKKEFILAMQRILQLKPVIDKFFDDVLVMTDDEKLRNNRLSLLQMISDTFRKLANFSKIHIEKEG